MPSFLKHIIRLTLFLFIAGTIASCQSWRDAKTVVKEADSLLVVHKVVTRDTAALLSAIHTLDGVLGRVFAREYLAKAYYFMGRNFYYLNDFSTAADYYILCDRMNPSDPMYKGRINSCMGYLCKQDSCFEEALAFYERANEAFEKSGDERRIANGLLSIAECYIFLHQYAIADSLLHIAERYDVADSIYCVRKNTLRGFWYYHQQQYDFALFHLKSVGAYSCCTEFKCFAYQFVIQVLYNTNHLNEALFYVEYIIQNSKNPCYLSNAYYVLILLAEQNDDVNSLAKYSYLREDMDRKNRHYMESYAGATTKLMTYMVDPEPFRCWKIALFICVVLILLAMSGVIVHKKRGKEITIQKAIVEAELHKWQEQMRENLAIEEANAAAKRKIISDIVMMHTEDFLPYKGIWKDEKELYRLANSSFGFIIYRLHDTYRNLNNREIKICLMVLLDFSHKMIANIACCSEESISTIKQRLARKLSTSPRELREFLMDFIMKLA